MTAPAVVSSVPPAPIAVPAVASLAIRPFLAGPVRRVPVLGASTHAVWLGGRSDVLVVSTRDATRLPNSVELPMDAARAPLEGLHPGAVVIVGSGAIVGSALSIRVVRWWDSKVTLPAIRAATLRSRLGGLPDRVPAIDSSSLAEAMQSRQPAALLDATTGLLGLGGGLTPEADDLLAGAIAGARYLGAAVGSRGVISAFEAVAPALSAMALARTTTFSAALLRHALNGDVAAPAAAFLNALAGRAAVAATHTQLTNVGHSSGAALAAGIVLAGRTLIDTE